MKYLFRKIMVCGLLCVFSTIVLADNNGVLVKTRIVMNVPSSIKLSTLEETIKKLVAKRTDKYSEYKGTMPDEIPTVPVEAKEAQSAATIDFSDSLYAVRAYSLSSFWGNSDAQVYILTIYPYIGGYRLYLYTYFRSKSNFLGDIGGAIGDVFSSDADLDEGFINTIKSRDILIQNIPQLTVYRQSPSVLKHYAFVDGKVIPVIPPLVVESAILVESSPKVESAVKSESAPVVQNPTTQSKESSVSVINLAKPAVVAATSVTSPVTK